MSNTRKTLVTACLIAFTASLAAQPKDGARDSAEANVFKPQTVAATPERMAQLRVPEGFSIKPFATGLKNARVLAVAEDGGVYVSRRDQGDVLRLVDEDGDGRADGEPVAVAHRAGAHGIAIHGDTLYLATVKEVFTADIVEQGKLGPLKMIVGDLPVAGQHANRTLAIGPDGMLYISVGSTCNVCTESSPELATILRATPDGASRVIMATGLRNTIGFDWHPETGELWGMDHGIDYLGDEEQPEEVNRIEQGKLYGWPHVYAEGKHHPASMPPGGLTKAQWQAMSEPMVLGHAAHAAPMQMLFVNGGGFPAEYQGDALVAMHGSWNRAQASGYEVVRVRFDDGVAKSIEPFVTGFLADGGRSQIGRPFGLAMAKDGSLLIGDSVNGVIYRVSHDDAKANPRTPKTVPAGPMREQAMRGVGVSLAMARAETKGGGVLKVTSANIEPGMPIPQLHTEYYDGVAPQLAWTPVEGAKSYAIIMEDPDSKPITPFVHWLAWNIPGEVLSLPQGVQEQLRLTEPDGVLQGRTSLGSVAYFGPRPPVGDAPHHYHFQVFALDRMLDVLPGADRDTLLKAMQGHVLAKGELIGSYQQTLKPLK